VEDFKEKNGGPEQTLWEGVREGGKKNMQTKESTLNGGGKERYEKDLKKGSKKKKPKDQGDGVAGRRENRVRLKG